MGGGKILDFFRYYRGHTPSNTKSLNVASLLPGRRDIGSIAYLKKETLHWLICYIKVQPTGKQATRRQGESLVEMNIYKLET